MQPPFISVITCTRNSEKYLPELIKSVEEQSFTDYEHIFIDGQSTDGTTAIIKEYQKTNPKKIHFFSFPPHGIADAMNKGIEKASGTYLIHLHSDDYFHDEKVLEDVAVFLKTYDPDWIYGKETRIDVNGRELGSTNKIIRFNSHSFFGSYVLKYFNYISHQSVFIKKKVFSSCGNFDAALSIVMDYDFWLRIRNSTKGLFFDRSLGCFRVHSDGTSSSYVNQSDVYRENVLISRKNMNDIEFYILRLLFKMVCSAFYTAKIDISMYRHLNKKSNSSRPFRSIF